MAKKNPSAGGLKKTVKKVKPAAKSLKKSRVNVVRNKQVKKPVKVAQKKAADSFENVHKTKIRVVGVGGGGGNIVAEVAVPLQKFDFIGANTDAQALKELPKKVRSFAFGQDFTNGLGCGMDADLGERCAKAAKDKIKGLLEGSDVCIIISSLGGGTGSGAAPVFAEVSQGLRSLTLGIFTMPFRFEGERRRQLAEAALEKIKPFVNAYVVIPNEFIFQVVDQKTALRVSLSEVNKRLAKTLEGFMETIALPGLINIDFADVRSILEGRGRLAYINSSEAAGPAKSQEVLQAVLANPLYEYGMAGADRVLFNIIGDRNLKMQDVAFISRTISENNPKARVVFGVSCSSRLKDRIRVTLFAVGCRASDKKEEEKMAKKHPPAGGEKRQKRVFPKKRVRVLQRKQKKEKILPEEIHGQQEGGPPAGGAESSEEIVPLRRNALEVRKAVDEEIKELEQKEKEWDIPAFLRNK
jgi:cell division protein FtsZ